MIKYLIVDDEHMAHDIIKGYCDLLPNMKLMKHCYDALEALKYLNEHSVDLIFLDLNMPKLKGFEFLRTLPSPPKIIITTAYKEYALEGYELNIEDYLLKPFSFERFLKGINKIFSSPTKEPIKNREAETTQRIFLRSDKKYTQVLINAILYMEASGNYVKVITEDRTILVRDKISNLIELLPENQFMRVHKSFAIAIKHITSIETNRVTIREFMIPVGKLYKLNIDTLLG